MKRFLFIEGVAAGLATLGLLIPQSGAMADGLKTAARPSIRMVETKVFDIALSKEATFSGRVVDHTGTALEGAEVTVKQGNKEVARSITDKNGMFAVSTLKGGVYSVSSGATEGTYRIWAEKSAPPSAKEQALLVMGQNGTRGQFGCCDPVLILLTAGVIASVVLSAITLDKVNKYCPQSP